MKTVDRGGIIVSSLTTSEFGEVKANFWTGLGS